MPEVLITSWLNGASSYATHKIEGATSSYKRALGEIVSLEIAAINSGQEPKKKEESSAFLDAAEKAAVGAATGAVAGPLGAAAGAVSGLLMSLLGSEQDTTYAHPESLKIFGSFR